MIPLSVKRVKGVNVVFHATPGNFTTQLSQAGFQEIKLPDTMKTTLNLNEKVGYRAFKMFLDKPPKVFGRRGITVFNKLHVRDESLFVSLSFAVFHFFNILVNSRRGDKTALIWPHPLREERLNQISAAIPHTRVVGSVFVYRATFFLQEEARATLEEMVTVGLSA
jgi:hypothetical protein